MLEKGEASKRKKTDETEKTKTASKHDPLLNTRRAEPITTYNRYSLLTESDDSDDEDSDISNANDRHGSTEQTIQHHNKHRPNKRLRMRRRQTTATEDDLDFNSADDIEIECKQHSCIHEHCMHGDLHNAHHNDTMQKMLKQCLDGPFARMISGTMQRVPPWRRDGGAQAANNDAMRDVTVNGTTNEEDWAKHGAIDAAQQLRAAQRQPTLHDTTTQQQSPNNSYIDAATHVIHSDDEATAQCTTIRDNNTIDSVRAQALALIRPSGGSPLLGRHRPSHASIRLNSSQLHLHPAHNSRGGGFRL